MSKARDLWKQAKSRHKEFTDRKLFKADFGPLLDKWAAVDKEYFELNKACSHMNDEMRKAKTKGDASKEDQYRIKIDKLLDKLNLKGKECNRVLLQAVAAGKSYTVVAAELGDDTLKRDIQAVFAALLHSSQKRYPERIEVAPGLTLGQQLMKDHSRF